MVQKLKIDPQSPFSIDVKQEEEESHPVEDGQRVSILANVNDQRSSEGYILIRKFNPAQKVVAALKTLGLFWGAILLTLPIPIVHFILPPVLFFVGIFMSYRTYQSNGRVFGGETTCPHCQTVVTVGKAELHWPVTTVCQGCARTVNMEPKDSSDF